jgi:rubrerythrin
MAVVFNAGEVFDIAQQIERNGARFYRRAAEAMGEQEGQTASLLLSLSDMERRHERVFAKMSKELSPQEKEQPLYDPYGEADQYLRALAGGYVFDLTADPNDWLGEGRAVAGVLHKAIGVEQESILFYLGMKESVPEKLGKERIEGIIKQEMNHVSLLAARLRVVEGKADAGNQ